MTPVIKKRADMLAAFGNSDSPIVADRTARACLLLPSVLNADELAKVAKLADHALEKAQHSQELHWFQLTRGLAAYRLGDLTNAIEWTGRVQERIGQAHGAAREICEAESY